MTLLIFLHAAVAGTGPWVPGAGQLHVYAGVSQESFETLNANAFPGSDERVTQVDIGQGIDTVTGVLDATYGIADRASVEFVVPVQYSHANRPDDAVCVLFGLGACRPTTSIGVIEARVKGLLSDQINGAPLTLAAGLVTRFGGLTSKDRERFTNAGEGTFDFGARVSAGRTGGLGSGYWVGSVDAEALYRVPNTDAFPLQEGDLRAPAPQFLVAGELLVAPTARVAFGPSLQLDTRPGGLDVGEMIATGLADVDRFSAIDFTVLRAGGKLILQDASYNAVSFSVSRTVYAVNNPNDTLTVSAGVSLNNLLRRTSE
jgi:hypothetical protein